MLEIIYDCRSLCARHTVEKLGLIALLYQSSHFPVFDWLSTSLKYLTQSANILSVATQVDLSFQCGVTAGFFLPRSMACAIGLPALDGTGCGQPLYLQIGPPRKCAGGSCDCGPTRRHSQSRFGLLRPVDGVVVLVAAAAGVPDVDV